MLNTKKIKKDFPIFKKHSNLVYLDSTATSLKPRSVNEALFEYYRDYSANVARGIYKIAEQATETYEQSRIKVAKFIHAKKSEEVIFTRGTTESLNLLAYTLGREIVGSGDEIVTTVMEHHSNFVPWQQLAFGVGADFKIIDIDDNHKLQETCPPSPRSGTGRRASNKKQINFKSIITKKTKILALTHVSNVLGTINPIKKIAKAAKKINPKIIIIVDGAQAVPHMKIDVQDLGCDFFAFSGHKMLGPTGVGVLWGRHELLERMFPFNFGGEMIKEVHLDKTTFKKPPHKFEAGTPHIAGAIGLGAAVEYLQSLGMDSVRRHEAAIVNHTLKRLKEEFADTLTLFGPTDAQERGAVIAFTFAKIHPHDIAQILDEDDIAIRVGSHCAMPLHTRLGIMASARASFYIYNDEEDVEKLISGLKKVKRIFQ